MENAPAEQDHTKSSSERDVLFLDCAADHHHITVSSLIAVFLQAYCHYSDAKIILVSEPGLGHCCQELEICPDHSSSENCTVTASMHDTGNNSASADTSRTNLNGLELPKCLHQCQILRSESLPRVVQDCQLPCILLTGQQMCVSGLANVLRWIVEVSAPKEPHRNLEALLVS